MLTSAYPPHLEPHVTKYRTEIDGLRALAVIAVLFYHCNIRLFSGGFVGVDVFFVISGYLITQNILQDVGSGTFSFANFYCRRIKRILPAALTVLLVTAAAALLIGKRFDADNILESGFLSAVSLANFDQLMSAGYFAAASAKQLFLHYWSLSVEEQFYLIWPLFLVVLLRLVANRVTVIAILIALTIVSFASCLRATEADPNGAFYLPYNRAWELLIGALAAFFRPLETGRWISLILRTTGLVTVVACFLLLDDTVPFPGTVALVACGGAVLMVLPFKEASAVDLALSVKPIRLVGLLSYSLYLWHWPAIVLVRDQLGREPTLLELCGLLILLFVISYASWRYIELPARAWKPQARSQAGLNAAFGVLLVGGLAFFFDNAQQRYWTAERYIVVEQARRAAYDVAPKVAFFGDSSCLTGVVPSLISSEIDLPVSSYCMFGDAGPRADAALVRELVKRGDVPPVIIYMVHPAQFSRAAIPTDWSDFASEAIQSKRPLLSHQPSSSGKLRGAFTERYGTAAQLVNELRVSGSLIDPSEGVTRNERWPDGLSTAYVEAVAELRAAFASANKSSIYLVVAPMPEGDHKEDLTQIVQRVAGLLGIQEKHILLTPPKLPSDLFAKHTHLNEQGRRKFSLLLGAAIKSELRSFDR